ncbi:acyltransferase domain-containing protein [Streptomyces griseocarneus]|uniref:acyltransferase domain-containing protein n=2 Tax=Streptomyces griseocarneus TaxID=51201 RepID=UPI001CCD7297|nr:acyltransferase domain-containing protein [Streptomyces griseocarneus]MBZ6475478.1 acyltransferase domain-containing protein [Streptomyces griseocarneus]
MRDENPIVVIGVTGLPDKDVRSGRDAADERAAGERMVEAARAAVEHADLGLDMLREDGTAVVTGAADRTGSAGRIAAALGLTGPSISLNTAHTPALAALHLAAQTLRSGESSYALIGTELHDGVCALLLTRESRLASTKTTALAVLRGSAMGHDPAPDDRTRVTGQALKAACLEPGEIVTQPAGGLAGVIETVLTGPSREADPPEEPGPRRPTVVSESGADGTTVHVVLDAPRTGTDSAQLPWVVTAMSRPALQARAASLAVHLDAAPASPADAAHSLLTIPPARHRAVVVGSGRTAMRQGLRALATGGDAPHLVRGTANEARRPVFVFPGQGSQWIGMAVELLDSSDVFRDSVHACADALSEFVDWSLIDVLREAPGAPPLRRVDVLQPTLWATMVSLAEVWRSYGVEPAAVVGHCYGEIAAAQVAGALDLRDAARLLARRSRAWLRLVGKGTVISVGTSEQDITGRMAAWPDSVELAAVNGPRSVALSGPPDALDDIVAELTAQGVYAKRIPGVETVGHCSQVDTLREHLLEVLRPVSPRASLVPFHSTVDGQQRDTATLDTDYWYLNTRSQVRFHDAVRSLLAAGHRTFIEVSPHPLLGMSIEDTAAELGIRDVTVLGTLRRGQGDTHRVLTSVAEAYVRGVDVDWSPAFAGTHTRRIDLPALVDFSTDAESSWTDRVGALPEADRAEAVLELVRRTLTEVLAPDSTDDIEAGTAFKEMGLGSLSAVQLRNRLKEVTGLHLPATIAFDHPTPAALARHLQTALFENTGARRPQERPEAALLAALDQADAALERLSADNDSAQRIEERLKALTDRVRRMRHTDDPEGSAADRFESADDDEMFALIEERFGIS